MRRMVLIGLLTGSAAAAQQPPEPRVYQVAGIRAGDVLNVRAGPSVDSVDLGDLAPGAAPVEVLETAAGGRWGRLLWRDANAWVAMAYLQPLQSPSVTGTALPAGLRCAGTEPFWGTAFVAPDGLHLTRPGAAEPLLAQVTATAPSQNSVRFPVAVQARAADALLTLTVRPAQCSDGMSERMYGWSADLLWAQADLLVLLSGCCGVPLSEQK